MRQPNALAEAVPLPPGQPALISLVPTQLARLMADPDARAWLRQLAVVWVGGAALPEALALAARQEDIRLSPCYGATETAAMVCALAPERFLAGDSGCGPPLGDVDLRIDPLTGTVEVATDRMSPGWIDTHGAMQPLLRTADGWWCSGDAGVLTPQGLEILGRRDGAILSGGETVFPEELEARLRALARREGWPLQEVLLLGVSEPAWGQRLTALVRPVAGACGVAEQGAALIHALEMAVMAWPVAERPRRWLLCDTLAPSATGKWQRSHWQRWLASLEADQTPLA
jgi:O-succinylbenzoic acid--CoA ligase